MSSPKNTTKVRRYEVVAQAHKNLVALRRVGCMWQWWDGFAWQGSFRTNYLMLSWLRTP